MKKVFIYISLAFSLLLLTSCNALNESFKIDLSFSEQSVYLVEGEEKELKVNVVTESPFYDEKLLVWNILNTNVVSIKKNSSGETITLVPVNIGTTKLEIQYSDLDRTKISIDITVDYEYFKVSIKDIDVLNDIKLGSKIYFDDLGLNGIDKVSKRDIEFISSNQELIEVVLKEDSSLDYLNVVGVGEGIISIKHRYGFFIDDLEVNFKTIFNDLEIGNIIKSSFAKDEITYSMLTSNSFDNLFISNIEVNSFDDLNYIYNLEKVIIYQVNFNSSNINISNLVFIKEILIEEISNLEDVNLILEGMTSLDKLTIKSSTFNSVILNNLNEVYFDILDTNIKSLNMKDTYFSYENNVINFTVSENILLDNVIIENLDFINNSNYNNLIFKDVKLLNEFNDSINISNINYLEIVDSQDIVDAFFTDNKNIENKNHINELNLKNILLYEDSSFNNYKINNIKIDNSSFHYIDFNKIESLKNIELNETNIIELTINKNNITNITVTNNNQLTSIIYNLDEVALNNKFVINNNKNLRELIINNARLSNSRSLDLTDYSKLEILAIKNSSLKDINFILNQDIQMLKELDLSNNNLSSISEIRKNNIEKLNLSNNNFTSDELKTKLVNNDHLLYLDVSNNNLSSTVFVDLFKKIEYLDLSNNNITSVINLDTLSNLLYLNIKNINLNNLGLDRIKDIYNAISNFNLLNIILDGNNFNSEQIIYLEEFVSYLLENNTNVNLYDINNNDFKIKVNNSYSELKLFNSNINTLQIENNEFNSEFNIIPSNSSVNKVIINDKGSLEKITLLELNIKELELINLLENINIIIEDDILYDDIIFDNYYNDKLISSNITIKNLNLEYYNFKYSSNINKFSLINSSIEVINIIESTINEFIINNSEVNTLNINSSNIKTNENLVVSNLNIENIDNKIFDNLKNIIVLKNINLSNSTFNILNINEDVFNNNYNSLNISNNIINDFRINNLYDINLEVLNNSFEKIFIANTNVMPSNFFTNNEFTKNQTSIKIDNTNFNDFSSIMDLENYYNKIEIINNEIINDSFDLVENLLINNINLSTIKIDINYTNDLTKFIYLLREFKSEVTLNYENNIIKSSDFKSNTLYLNINNVILNDFVAPINYWDQINLGSKVKIFTINNDILRDYKFNFKIDNINSEVEFNFRNVYFNDLNKTLFLGNYNNIPNISLTTSGIVKITNKLSFNYLTKIEDKSTIYVSSLKINNNGILTIENLSKHEDMLAITANSLDIINSGTITINSIYNGSHGYKGSNGSSGTNGNDGGSNKPTRGSNGKIGSNGINGLNGSNAILINSKNGTFNINNITGKITINAGSGGNGGDGGNGGAGGNGGNGRDGKFLSAAQAGANGGNGGNGGRGGDGGHAGRAINISTLNNIKLTGNISNVIQNNGTPGRAGAGGAGGAAGFGGKGGLKWNTSSYQSNGSNGTRGSNGQNGSNGSYL